MKTIVILADTVRRDFLSVYGNEWVKTPNLDRLAKKGIVFDNHWCGSAPCMPARRDLFTGRLNFLERGWGGIEPYDITLPQILKRNNIYTTMITDHYHYLELGGENYCQLFDSWMCIRGQEMDALPGNIKDIKSQKEGVNRYSGQHYSNSLNFTSEENFPTPKTFLKAIDWLETNKNEDDYLLWIEGFDPHEPFDVPDEYLEIYEKNITDESLKWPKYGEVDVSPKEIKSLRKSYAASLSLMDKYLGKILDFMDDNDFWDDTMLVFTTDHGFLLGEHDLMGKNITPAYNEVFHIPLIITHPNQNNDIRRVEKLTQNIDLLPTILDFHNIHLENTDSIRGKSLFNVMSDKNTEWRKAVIYGYFGRSINIFEGEHTYFKAPVSLENSPLSILGSVMSSLWQFYGHGTIRDFQEIQMGRYLSWTDYPVYKIEASNLIVKDKVQDFTVRNKYNDTDYLFNIETDYSQLNPIEDKGLEDKLKKLMIEEMKYHDSPYEQFIRLGLVDE